MITILSELTHYLAIHKPSGIHTVSLPKSDAPSLASLVATEFPHYASSSPNSNDSGLVNRLDFDTSGIVFLAKSKSAWSALHQLHKNKEVTKEYLCLVETQTPINTSINGWIGARGRSSKKVKWFRSKPSASYRAREITLDISTVHLSSPYGLLRIRTNEGIRHQIRVGCSHIGLPLVGDTLYGSISCLPWVHAGSFFLHSETASFKEEDQQITVISDILPEYLAAFTNSSALSGVYPKKSSCVASDGASG